MNSSNGGFIDLRVGHSTRGIGDDSVWPSFTDIMTVIVMIFLMALVIMMVRNFELDRQLVSTVTAKEAGALENRGLVSRINVLESRVRGLQESLGESISARGALQAQLLQEQQRIESLIAGGAELEQQRGALQAQLSQEEQRVESLIAGVAELEVQLAGSISERGDLQAQLLQELKRIELLVADNVSLDQQLTDIIAQRNQLIGEKRQLTEQGEQARAQITDLTAAEGRLSREITALSDQFDTLQLQSTDEIETLTDANLSLTEQLQTVASQLEQVRALLETEQQQRRALGEQVEAQSAELLAKEELLRQLQLSQSLSAQASADANARIEELNELIRRRQVENAELQQQADAAGVQFRSLQEEYESLDAKYRSLVRPARTPAGKHVVDVRIDKTGGQFHYQLKEPSQDAPVDYDKEELKQRLASLKDQHGEDLYTRVIIPQNNQLSHNEAWQFTQEILQGYDYYHQQYPDALGGGSVAE